MADLEKFFQSRPASTTLTLEQAIVISRDEIELNLCAVPWWVEQGQAQGREAQLRLVLSGVRESSLENIHQLNVINNFHFSSNDVLLWHYGQQSSIVGNAPLPDPPRFFSEYFALHTDHCKIPRPISTYLFWPGTFREWTVSVYNRTYPFFTGPSELATEVAKLLDRQAAEYALLPEPEVRKAGPLYAVWLDKSWIVFESAALETRSRES